MLAKSFAKSGLKNVGVGFIPTRKRLSYERCSLHLPSIFFAFKKVVEAEKLEQYFGISKNQKELKILDLW